MNNAIITVGIGTSVNPTEAISAAISIIKAKCAKPKLLALFTTIHYCSESGRKTILETMKQSFPEQTPMIGCTITGFMCTTGVYTRGLAVVAVGGEEIECHAAIARNAKFNPKTCGFILSKQLEHMVSPTKTEKAAKLLIEISPGPIEPSLMTSKNATNFFRALESFLPEKLFIRLKDFITWATFDILKYGNGNEEEILQSISSYFKDTHLFGVSSFDDIKALRHYQFFDYRSYTNATVVALIHTSLNLFIEYKLPVIRTGKNLTATIGWRKFYIEYINNKRAAPEYLAQMGWPNDYISSHVKQLFNKTFFHPFGFTKDGILYAFPSGLFIGNSIATNRKIHCAQLELLMTSTKLTIKNVSELLEKIDGKKKQFTLFNFGINLIGMFGPKIYELKKTIDEKCGKTEYLVLFGAGEHFMLPGMTPSFNNYSLTMLALIDDN